MLEMRESVDKTDDKKYYYKIKCHNLLNIHAFLIIWSKPCFLSGKMGLDTLEKADMFTTVQF